MVSLLAPRVPFSGPSFNGSSQLPARKRRESCRLPREPDRTIWAYIDRLEERGEQPCSASFVMQYMYSGLKGQLPRRDSDTAWPPSSVGHQPLFKPVYRNAQNDELTQSTAQALNQVTYAQQRKVGGFLANDPNYIAPGDSGHQVWAGHVWKLSLIKQKYDAVCLIRNVRVFASQGCTAGGWANIFSK